MDGFEDKNEGRRQRKRRTAHEYQDYQVIAGRRWTIIVAWLLLIFGVGSSVAICILTRTPWIIGSRPGAGFVALTIGIVWWWSEEKNESPHPLFFCGLVWSVVGLLQWHAYLEL